jgi:hypothetical protein
MDTEAGTTTKEPNMRPDDVIQLAAKIANHEHSAAEMNTFLRRAWLADYEAPHGSDMPVFNLATHKPVADDVFLFAAMVADGKIKLHKDATPKPTISYLYETRTPTIPLTVETQVATIFISRVFDYTPAPCQSHASITCNPKNPEDGFARILPESMLPGSKPEMMIQCLQCYEASAEAYNRKLHQ